MPPNLKVFALRAYITHKGMKAIITFSMEAFTEIMARKMLLNTFLKSEDTKIRRIEVLGEDDA